MKYFFLCALWFLWCLLHSSLITVRSTEEFKKHLRLTSGTYRIFYNLFSLVTVLPLLYWQRAIPGPVVIPLSPLLLTVKHVVVVFSLMVILGAFASFDVWKFIGLRQTKKRENGPVVIRKHGLYGIVRHPMYLGAFVYFAASMTHVPLAQFLGYLILAVYMIIGTFREDRRLAGELGDVYRNYQKEVPMLLPNISKEKAPSPAP